MSIDMLGLVIAAVLAAAGPTYDAHDEAAARAWIAGAGHRFDVSMLSAGDLRPMVERLRPAKLIGVGEATHGTHQDQAFKAELIKALVSAGAVDTLVLECNRACGEGFDHYVREGVGDPAALMRSRSTFVVTRNDAFGGLLLWLRGWNQTTASPVRVIGVDDQDSGVDAKLALSFLGRFDAPAAAKLRGRMRALLDGPGGEPKRLIDWAVETERAPYFAMKEDLDELKGRFDSAPVSWRRDKDFEAASYAADVAAQGPSIFEAEFKGADRSKLDEAYYTRRDRFMADNLMRLLGAGRGVLWAHDSHVASRLDATYEAKGLKTLGVLLKERLGDEYRTVGFTWSHATVRVVSLPDSAPTPSGERVYSELRLDNDKPASFGHVFSALPGDGWWIDLDARPHTPALDRWGARPLWRGYLGWRVDPAGWETDLDGEPPPDRGFDLLVWFRTMSPSRTWAEPRVSPG